MVEYNGVIIRDVLPGTKKEVVGVVDAKGRSAAEVRDLLMVERVGRVVWYAQVGDITGVPGVYLVRFGYAGA
jgi:hypothetical protein